MIVAEHTRDARECRQVLLGHRPGTYDADQYRRRHAVDGIEIDARLTDHDRRPQLIDTIVATVRNRDAATDSGASQALTFEKNLVDHLFIGSVLRRAK